MPVLRPEIQKAINELKKGGVTLPEQKAIDSLLKTPSSYVDGSLPKPPSVATPSSRSAAATTKSPVAPSASTNPSDTVVRKLKTLPPNLSVKEKLEKPSYYNVLNNYRSYTYNFTLAALSPEQYAKQIYLTQEKLDNVVLKTSGKAEKGEIPKVKITYGTPPAWIQQEIDYFNAESAGRYDLYIDNVEIENVPTPAMGLGTGLVTNVKFDVTEPYSSVGFIEALIATARASGYIFHTNAVFLLKIEFKGYRDDTDINQPAEIVPKATRYLPIRFKKIDVEITQAGTVYRCECMPAGDIALADDAGSVKTAIQISGIKVKEILQDLFTKLNAQNLDNLSNIAKKKLKQSEIDTYEVLFPSLRGNEYDEKTDNSIAEKPLKKLYSDNTIYEFGKIDDKQFVDAYQRTGISGQERKFVAYEPSKLSVSYMPGTTIQSIIDGIVRDSEYWREQIDPNTAKLLSDDDHVKFWKVVPKVSEENKEINPIYKRYARHVVYYVIEEKIHKSRVPMYKGFTYGDDSIKIVREYNYIYTGQNIDITNFKINLDRLFYESIPWGLGVSDSTPVRSSLLPGNSVNPTINAPDTQNQAPGGETPGIQNSSVQGSQGNASTAGEIKKDPIANLARISFDQIIASPFSMVKADMEILGDPAYIMTFINSGNLPKLSSEDPAFTDSGEANFLSQAVYLKIFFRTPVDIDDGSELSPAEKREGRLRATGLAKFTSRYDWTGVWQLIKCYSYFKSGVFTQRLELRKEPIEISNKDSYKPPEVLETTPNPKDQIIADAGAGKIIPSNKRSSLQSLLQGVNNVADSLASVEARIVGAVQGAISTVATGVAEIVSVPAKAIGDVTNEINGALQGVNNLVTGAANKLNLDPSQLASLSAKELLATVAISKLLPENVDAERIEEKDLLVSKSELRNIPPLGNNLNLSDTINITEIVKQTEAQVKAELDLLLAIQQEELEKQNLN